MATLHNDSGSQLSYFANDGSYGDANAMVVVDTSDWTHEIWMFISEETDDYNRGFFAELFEAGATIDEAQRILVDTRNGDHIFASADFTLHRLREGIDN